MVTAHRQSLLCFLNVFPSSTFNSLTWVPDKAQLRSKEMPDNQPHYLFFQTAKYSSFSIPKMRKSGVMTVVEVYNSNICDSFPW